MYLQMREGRCEKADRPKETQRAVQDLGHLLSEALCSRTAKEQAVPQGSMPKAGAIALRFDAHMVTRVDTLEKAVKRGGGAKNASAADFSDISWNGAVAANLKCHPGSVRLQAVSQHGTRMP